jgi:rhamnose transport system substrate-binding protein
MADHDTGARPAARTAVRRPAPQLTLRCPSTPLVRHLNRHLGICLCPQLKGFTYMRVPFKRTVPAVAALLLAAVVAACSSSPSSSSSGVTKGANGLDKGLKVFIIPKNLGNNYFTTADSAKSGGAIAALDALGETGTETSGTAATPASQIPAIQAAIAKGANVLIVSATDPTALCPTLDSAMKKGITVVTYDSDAPTCRDMFINQASTAEIGTSEVDVLAKEIHDTGQIGIVSAAATATNQNAWIGYMKQELTKYPNIQLVSTVYGNDDPTTATQVTEGLLQQYPNLKGIISPTTVGILAAAQVVSTPQWKGKVIVTGLGTPLEMKSYVASGVCPEFVLWNPANLGYLAAYAAVELASHKITNAAGQAFTAGKLGKYTVGADHTVLLGPPTVFDAANVNQFHF